VPITRWLSALHAFVHNWVFQRARYMSLETIAPLSDDPIVVLAAAPAA
jgi:hypothetical protein